MPAVVDQALDPTGRRLAIQSPPPGERGGLEEAVQGRGQRARIRRCRARSATGGMRSLAARRRSIARPGDGRGLAGTCRPAIPRRNGGMPRARAHAPRRQRDRRGREAEVQQRPGPLAQRGVRTELLDAVAAEAEVQVFPEPYCPHIRAARATWSCTATVIRPSAPERPVLVAPPVLQVEPRQAIREQRDGRSSKGASRSPPWSRRRRPIAASRFWTVRRSCPACRLSASAWR